MIKVGLAGVGFMGWIHRLAYQQTDGIELGGFCSRDPGKRSGDWTSIQGNFGPPGETFDVSSINVYEEIDGLLNDPSIDLIDICLPPHMHGDVIERALSSGKRVFCEKPLALSAAEANKLVRRANDPKPGQLMVAHILPFMNEYQFLVAAADSKRYGNLRSLRLKRFISPPDWIPDFYDRNRVGGPLIDLHVHDAHLVRLVMGMPDQVMTANDQIDGNIARYETLMTFDDGRYVSSGGGVIDAPGRPFTHGFEAMFDDATVQFQYAAYADQSDASIPLVVMHHDGRLERPSLGDGDPVQAFVRQAAAVCRCIESGDMPPALDPALAADALAICERQRTS